VGCGFEYDLGKAQLASAAIVQGSEDFVSILNDGAADLTARREPQTWSPLEYGCHVRDALLVQRNLLGRQVSQQGSRNTRSSSRDSYCGSSLVSPSQSLSSKSSARTKMTPSDASVTFQWWLPPLGRIRHGRRFDSPTVGQRSGHGIVVEVGLPSILQGACLTF
jgi:hypothetical protein